jgi:arginyl-tRNA synthetase
LDLLDPEESFRKAIQRAAREALGVEPESVPLTYPPNASLGDLATPVCFELARVARKAPKALAEAIAAAFAPGGGVSRVEPAGNGYLNAFLDRGAYLEHWLERSFHRKPTGDPEGDAEDPVSKVIVEHTNINPNKAAHIGHLRNAVLGDTLVRCLRRIGRKVEVQNYIDDTGVQVADLVIGFRVLRGEELNDVEERYADSVLAERGERFDYVAWDLYAEVTRYYAEDSERQSHRDETLHAMERGGNPIAELAAHVARRMVRHHLATMRRIDVKYDLLPRESDILELHFWETAFERLKQSGAIRLVDSGKHAGCWVMRLAGAEEGAGEDEKIIVRSNGTVTYVGKDIAYQLWKFGLLGRDFDYAPFEWSKAGEGYPLWSTRSGGGAPEHPAFGNGHTVYNVIDRRQSYLQRVVSQGLLSLGHEEEAERSIHYAYEMVALTPASVSALLPDFPLDAEELAKPYLEMSGRRGLGIRADDLLDALFERARSEVAKRNTELSQETLDETARRIGVGALRYYMLRFSRNRVVAFDLDDALAFEGETGPYLQYSVVRAKNILGKVAAEYGAEAISAESLAGRLDFDAIDDAVAAEHWNLALQLFRVDATVVQAVESLELSTVAKHAYLLAQTFNSFYHRFPVLREQNEAVRVARTALVRLYHDGMVALLRLLGIEVPERM